ncbi:MAG: ABC transporter permease [Bacteroidales bacterium]|nr:ABC transporter permease [Bacteroidales bacterium]
MNLHTIKIIIGREYLNRVKKKSFLVTTFVVPVLMAALCVVPIVMMVNSKEKTKTVAYVDRSGIVGEYLENTETINYVDMTAAPDADSLKNRMEELSLDAVLSISALDSASRSVNADITSRKPLGLEMSENINNRINKAVENYRIASYNIEGLEDIMNEVKANVRLRSYTMDDSGEEKISEAGVNSILSMILGMFIFIFVTVFGSMVMSAVIEEKASRVVEVLVSSVKATELMFGKIIGVAAVALTQFLLWIILTVAIVGVAGSVLGEDIFDSLDAQEVAQTAGVNVDGEAIAQLADQSELSTILSTIQGLDFTRILVVFFVFFILGYLLYASMFAAIGSAVENEGDTQQLQLPLTIPLMLAYFIAIYAFRAPDSAIAFWGSMIPFTSPIVMLARVPFGVETWEILVSVALLIVTTGLMAWLSAKIYKVGILMFGKKSTWKDLWKWLKQK